MKRYLFIAVVILVGYAYCHRPSRWTSSARQSVAGLSAVNAADSAIAEAYRNHISNIQVTGSGSVVRILPDDNVGSRHQRFILRLASGQPLLIAHHIDVAPRIDHLLPGDSVEFYGEYVWNEKGGVLHWTHRAANGSHASGWLRHCGSVYQ